MPKLPDYTALGERPVPQPASGVAGYTPADPTTFSRGLGAAANDLQQASDILLASNQRQDQMVAEAALNQLQARRLELEMGDGGFQSVKGAGAVGPKFVENYSQKFGDIATDIQGSLQNDNQRRLFQQREPLARLQYRSALLKHQATETDKFNEQTENDTIDLARRQIFNSNDPQAVDAGLLQINWAIDQKAKRLGWGDAVAADTKRKFTEKVMEDVAGMQVERDPVNALAAINKRMGIGTEQGASGVTAIDSLDINKLIELRHRAVSYVAQADNKAKAEAEKRQRDAESATTELQKFTLTGQMVSPQYEREVLAKVTGTPQEAAARQMINASYTGATHGSVPLPEQERRLRMLDEFIAANGSSPKDSQLAGEARQITDNQKREYKENPWAAATRFGRQMQVPEAQITNPTQVPQLIAQRLPLMTGVELFAGQPVSPLQPNEAKAFAEQLKALPPDARAEVLAQTGSMLSAPRAAALSEQLDKHDEPLAIALTMGMDRTTAGLAASRYVLRGAQALADKTVKKDDAPVTGWEGQISTYVRGTFDAKTEDRIIKAAFYARAGLEAEGIAAPGFKPMSANVENALAMVIGVPMERAGVRTFLPRGMQQREFDDRLKLAGQNLAQQAPSGQLYVRGAPVPVAQIANHLGEYGLKRDGQGRYVPVVRNAPITLDPQGQQMLRLDVR